VLLSVQDMSPPAISEVAFTDTSTSVRPCFSRDGLTRCTRAARAAADVHAAQASEIKPIALADRQNLDSVCDLGLSKPADYLVAEGLATDISHEGLRLLLRARRGSAFKP
jgi:hypothetical protein